MENARPSPERKPRKSFEQSLYDFMCMGKGQSQSLVIRYFLEQAIMHSDLCEQGSALVYCAPDDESPTDPGKLKLLDKEKNVNSLDFPGYDFDIDKGLAGLAFRKRAPNSRRRR